MSPRFRALTAIFARDLGGVAGAGLIVAGVAEFSGGLAMIVAGALLVVAALKLARNG
jgi:hypothetical protein